MQYIKDIIKQKSAQATQRWFDYKMQKMQWFSENIRFGKIFTLLINLTIYFWAIIGIFLAFGLLRGRGMFKARVHKPSGRLMRKIDQ
jgi:hypothetical protein